MWQVDVCQWLPARIGRSECLNPAIGKPKTTGVMWRGTKPVAHSAQRLSPALRAPPMPLRRTRHRLGLAIWSECRAPNTSPPSSVGSGLVLRHCKRELARVPCGNVAIQDLTPAAGAPHTKDPASWQAGPGGSDLWGAEEHRRAVCAFSARPLHHEPAPGPACRDARQSNGNPSTESGKRPAASGRRQTINDLTAPQVRDQSNKPHRRI